VDGNTHGAGIHFTITWPNGSVGVYDGTLHRPFSGPSGDGDGTTYDQAHPWSRATWNIYGDARCFW
jgi:hypothetical protein